MRALAIILALLAISPSGSDLKVTKERAAMMEKPQYWGRSIGQVVNGQKVTVIDQSRFPWLKVKVKVKDKVGYVHSSAFEAARRISFATAAEAQDQAAPSERSVTLAARGLTKEVESGYREKNKNLEAAFELLDRHEEADARGPSDDEMRAFFEEGELLPALRQEGGTP